MGKRERNEEIWQASEAGADIAALANRFHLPPVRIQQVIERERRKRTKNEEQQP